MMKIVLTLLVLIGAGAVYTWHSPKRNIPSTVELRTNQGDSLQSIVKSGYTVLNFGYATCPDVCPTGLAYAAKEFKGLHSKDWNFVFVSVDGERDKMPALQLYVSYFDPEFRAVLGSSSNTAVLADALGVSFRKVSSDSKAGYLIDHSSGFYLINSQGELLSLYNGPQLKGALREWLLRNAPLPSS